jgi:SpoVK/Ycf46/Vps4 family AAA+-type ATPase
MDNKKLSLLKALVSAHQLPENPRDQMLQKGKGLVILLHGAPGSGKTITAECAAEAARRALLVSSLSELNRWDDPWSFEVELKELFQYATIWKAIVLLDEADVFLEARKDDENGLERNALVATFLKYLEYFSGIVFLTTNRAHVLDEAMRSRIQAALGFDPPDRDIQEHI